MVIFGRWLVISYINGYPRVTQQQPWSWASWAPRFFFQIIDIKERQKISRDIYISISIYLYIYIIIYIWYPPRSTSKPLVSCPSRHTCIFIFKTHTHIDNIILACYLGKSESLQYAAQGTTLLLLEGPRVDADHHVRVVPHVVAADPQPVEAVPQPLGQAAVRGAVAQHQHLSLRRFARGVTSALDTLSRPLQEQPRMGEPYGGRANGCQRLRTVANTNATFGDHSLAPKPPRWNGNPCYAFGNMELGLQISWHPVGSRLQPAAVGGLQLQAGSCLIVCWAGLQKTGSERGARRRMMATSYSAFTSSRASASWLLDFALPTLQLPASFECQLRTNRTAEANSQESESLAAAWLSKKTHQISWLRNVWVWVLKQMHACTNESMLPSVRSHIVVLRREPSWMQRMQQGWLAVRRERTCLRRSAAVTDWTMY